MSLTQGRIAALQQKKQGLVTVILAHVITVVWKQAYDLKRFWTLADVRQRLDKQVAILLYITGSECHFLLGPLGNVGFGNVYPQGASGAADEENK